MRRRVSAAMSRSVAPQLPLVRPFFIDIPEATIRDLRERLTRTRWPGEVPDSGWEYGANLGYLKDLVAYWRDAFDWRAQERRLNELSHFRTDIDGLGIHFIHIRGNGPSPFPLVLTHGWPSSFFELTKLIPLLVDPAAHGSDPSDAFDVVVPSMPGFGFSSRPTERFVSARVADLWTTLMRRLGYKRFGAHGGDIGGGVSARLGQFHPEVVAGIHVTNVYATIGENDSPLTQAERRHFEQQAQWEREEGAYGDIQATRPQTLAYGLNDSPAGLAAWIVEKYRAWSDCSGDVESVFSKDELLTNITIYWATETIGSSFQPYWDSRNNPNPRPWVPITVPCGIAVFPQDLGRPPRELVERSYNVQRWTEMPRGGHFAAFEEPQLLAQDIRAFFRQLRQP
jgi:pimeloyl-ACP methyl ester carboxylesterase